MKPLFTNRNKLILLAWGALLFGLIFTAVEIKLTLDERTRQVMIRNLFAARQCARFIDEQCKTAAPLLRMQARRYAFVEQLRLGDEDALRSELQEMTAALPNLAAVSIHYRNGQMAEGFPVAITSGNANVHKIWFQNLADSRSAGLWTMSRFSDSGNPDVLVYVLPLGAVGHPSGYLLAYYRLNVLEPWLHLSDYDEPLQLSIVNTRGDLLTRGSVTDSEKSASKRLLQNAKSRPEGPLVSWPSRTNEDSVGGYARAQVPNWIVALTLPTRFLMVSSFFQVLPLLFVVLGNYAFLFLAAWNFARMHDRQEAMQQRLLEQNKHLKVLDEAKSEFLANVSHDMWTPLASLEMSLTGLLDPKIQWRPDQVRESLQLANHELSQLINRVRNLLEMARLDANANMAQKEPCDLVDIAGSALERLSPLLKERPVHADFPAYPLMFMCRHAQVEIVIINLVDNALKYSPSGSPLYLKGERRGSDLYMSLRDCGPGVAPEDSERIFQKFYRAQKAHTKGGTGLGLAICKAVIENHGGVIGVFNAPGGGAEFWFSVPGMPKER